MTTSLTFTDLALAAARTKRDADQALRNQKIADDHAAQVASIVTLAHEWSVAIEAGDFYVSINLGRHAARTAVGETPKGVTVWLDFMTYWPSPGSESREEHRVPRVYLYDDDRDPNGSGLMYCRVRSLAEAGKRLAELTGVEL